MTGPALTILPEDGDEQKPSKRTTLFPSIGEKMRQSVRLGENTPPEKAARILSLQQSTTIPPEVISRNLETIEKEQASRSLDPEVLRRTSPAVASWISEHPNHASIAKDDLANLTVLEGMWHSLKRGAQVGRAQSEQGKLGFLALERRGRIDDPTQKRLQALEAEISREPTGRDFFTNVLFQGAKLYGQMSDAIPDVLHGGAVGMGAGGSAGLVAGAITGPGATLTAAGGATGGFFVGAGAALARYTFEVEAGQAYLEMSKIRGQDGQALDSTVVQAASVGVGVLNAGLEMGGVSLIAAPFRAAARKFTADAARDMLVRPTMRSAMAEFGKHYSVAIAGETGTEVLQEMTNITAEELTKMASDGQFASVMRDPEQRELAISRLTDIASQTASGMLLVGLPGASVNLATDVVRARKATQREQVYLAMGEGVKNSKTYERLPEALQTIVERATKDGPIENVFVDVESFQEYFQSQNADPRDVARELWGNTEEYDQAVQTGTALSIPMSRYATKLAPTEHSKFFARELRQSPDGMNAREAAAFLKQAEEQAAAEPVSTPDAREQLTKTISAQIEETGRFRGADAETLATQMAAFFTAQGERYGIDPVQLFNRYGLQVLRGETARPTRAAVPQPDEAAMERAAIAGESGDVAGVSTLRNAAGRLPTKLSDATEQQLADEHFRLVMANAEDSQLQVPTVNEDEGGHSSSLFRPYIGMKGSAVYASGRIAARNKSIERIEAEMTARGLDPSHAFRKSVAGEALSSDVDFDFGQNVGDILELQQSAFHGSPHIFDEFSLQKIGTGEGAQAFGWGLYFTGKKEIAKYYREKLSPDPDTMVLAGKPLDRTRLANPRAIWPELYDGLSELDRTRLDRLLLILTNATSVDEARGFAEELGQDDFRFPFLFSERVEYDLAPPPETPGRLYKVDIPDDDTMLQWDKLLTEQSPAVQAALEAAGIPVGSVKYPSLKQAKNLLYSAESERLIREDVGLAQSISDGRRLVELWDGGDVDPARAQANFKKWFDAHGKLVSPTRHQTKLGSDAYQELVAAEAYKFQERLNAGEQPDYVSPQELASRKLAEAGIVGIKYPAGTLSSGQGDAFNYVIFDDKLVEILEFEQKNRGRIRITKERQISIDLLENADFSTFLHESGHAYLEILTDLAAQNEGAAADLATIREWLGAKGETPLTREQHEQFARGTEAYLMEGIAPSIALRRAFFRFKAWLKALYSTIRSLEVELTPEVRDVFDRMFASDGEIEAAENEASIVPIFTDAESAGMSETEFAAYRQTVEDAHIQATDRLRTQLIAESIREQRQWWKEARAETRKEVEAEINEEPVYRALSILQRGELPDGTLAEEAFKLSKAGIVALKGEEFPKRLPKPYVYSREGGIDPDQAAQLLGFSSGDELLQALANAPKREQVIEGETDLRMKARYGDMRVDGSIAEIAEASVLGEYREKVIRAELAALRKKAREVAPFVRAEQEEQQAARKTGRQILSGVPSPEFVRNVAQNRLAPMRVRDIKPFLFWVAARKANRQALELVAKGDYAGAADAQQAHLMNVALYREATRIKEEVDEIVQYARKLQKPTIQARIGKAAHGYLDQINKILERFDFSPSTLRENDRRASLASFIKQMEAENIPVTIPEDIQNEAFRKPWAEMSYEELVGVKDTLKHLDYLSLRWNRLLKSIETRTLEEAVEAAVASIDAHASKTLQRKLETRLPAEQPLRKVQAFIGSLRKYASIIREMDGVEDNGVLWNLLVRPLNGAADALTLMNKEMGGKLDEIFATYTKAERIALPRKLEFVPELQTSLTKMGKLMIALNWGTEDNRAKLMAGMGITLGRPISQAEIEGALDSLDQRDWDFVKSIWRFINDYWPEFKGLVERMDGIAPEKVEGAPVITKFGEFEGMYFPLKYDDRQSKDVNRNVIAQRVSQVVAGAAARASTKAGARHERIAGVRLPLRLDFGVIFEHMSEIAMDLTHTEALLDVNRILGHADMEAAIQDHYGDQVYKQLLDSVKDVAVGDVPAQNTFEQALNWTRVGATIAALSWNLMTSFLQPLGLTQSMVRIGPKWVARGISRWIRDAAHMENTAKWIRSKSEFMRTRTDTQSREIGEIRNKLGLTRSRMGMYLDMGISKATVEKLDLQDVEDSFFWFITRMQLVADIPTWLGAYEKALETSPDDEAGAIALADQAVIDAQGSGHIKDLADIQKGSPALKLFTNFYSFFSTTYNLHVESVRRTDFKSPASIGRLGVDLLLLSVVPVVLAHFMKAAVRGDDDDENLLVALAREELAYITGMVVGLREIGGAIQGFHGYEGPAGSRIYSEFGKLVQQIQQGDSDRALWRSLNQTAGILFHYPAGQVQRTIEGFMAWSEHPSVNLAPLLFGPPRK